MCFVDSLIYVHLETTSYDSFSRAIVYGINIENAKIVIKTQLNDIIKIIFVNDSSEVFAYYKYEDINITVKSLRSLLPIIN